VGNSEFHCFSSEDPFMVCETAVDSYDVCTLSRLTWFHLINAQSSSSEMAVRSPIWEVSTRIPIFSPAAGRLSKWKLIWFPLFLDTDKVRRLDGIASVVFTEARWVVSAHLLHGFVPCQNLRRSIFLLSSSFSFISACVHGIILTR
jgi:hypothetical protein